MFCQNVEYKNVEGAAFCENCGTETYRNAGKYKSKGNLL